MMIKFEHRYHMLRKRGCDEVEELPMTRVAIVDPKDDKDKTLLSYAAALLEDAAVVELLLTQGATVGIKGFWGSNAVIRCGAVHTRSGGGNCC